MKKRKQLEQQVADLWDTVVDLQKQLLDSIQEERMQNLDELRGLRMSLEDEFHTRRLVVEDEKGQERIVASATANLANLVVEGPDGDHSVTLEVDCELAAVVVHDRHDTAARLIVSSVPGRPYLSLESDYHHVSRVVEIERDTSTVQAAR
jgi:regulator of replication initiation timing